MMKRITFQLPIKCFMGLFLIMALASCTKDKKSNNSTNPVQGGGSNPTPPTPVWDPNAMRGIWITTTASNALDSRANIKDAVQFCKTSGINHIFMVVYNNARTMYPSEVMQDLIGVSILEKFSGRDPLKEMIEEAHAAGLKVHAWFEYGFASSYSANGGQILLAKPNWGARDANGKLTVKNGFDWLNAFHPEVQNFMIGLFKEVVSKYNVDGVQGDDRLPALPSTAGYDDYTKNLYRSENAGSNPPANYTEPEWIKWRAGKLNAFCKQLRMEVKKIKPSILYTMSPSPYPWGLNEYLQDWPTWVDSSWVDAVIPQCYRYDITAYNASLSQQKSYHRNQNIPLYPGVLLRVGSYTASDVFLSQMIQSNRKNNSKGEVFFFYEGLKERQGWFKNQYPFIK